MEQSQREGTRVLDSLAYWSNTLEGLKENLQQLRDMQQELQRRQDRAKELAVQRDKARPKGDPSLLTRIEAEMEGQKPLITRQQGSCDDAHARFRAEWARFWREKREEWKQVMATFVQLRITAAREEINLQYEPVIDCW